MLAALLWHAVFVLGLRDVWRRGLRDGLSSMAFQTRRPGVAWLLAVVAAMLGAGTAAIAVAGLSRGSVVEFCRHCTHGAIAWAERPFAYAVVLLAQVELAIVMCFVVYLAGNTLRAIRRGQAP